jgi:hypothetical protein
MRNRVLRASSIVRPRAAPRSVAPSAPRVIQSTPAVTCLAGDLQTLREPRFSPERRRLRRQAKAQVEGLVTASASLGERHREVDRLALRPGDHEGVGGVVEWHDRHREPACGRLIDEHPFVELSERSPHHIGAPVPLLRDQFRTGLAKVIRRVRGRTGPRIGKAKPFDPKLHRVLSARSGWRSNHLGLYLRKRQRGRADEYQGEGKQRRGSTPKTSRPLLHAGGPSPLATASR